MDDSVLHFIKDWLWAPLIGLVAWAWNRNEREHNDLRAIHTDLTKDTSKGYSTLNDRIMGHVDERVEEVKQDHGKRIEKINGHIEKLFENAEKDRAAFREALTVHSNQSTERHIELMQAIHVGLAGKADRHP